jgi:hypothetical protein
MRHTKSPISGWVYGIILAAVPLFQGNVVLGTGHAVVEPLSFFPPYEASRVNGWNIMGSTMVTEQFVRLTSAEPGQEGALWSAGPNPPQRFHASSNWI